MFSIYFAINNNQMESFIISKKNEITNRVNDEVTFVGNVSYREAILQGVKDFHPSLLILREGLSGDISIVDLIYQIRVISPETRVLFMSSERHAGDGVLASLVNLGIYDIMIGDKVMVNELMDKITTPSSFASVAFLIPKPSVADNSNTVVFTPPDASLYPTKEIIKEIPVHKRQENYINTEVITFIGPRHGIGITELAFGRAAALAYAGNRVCYIDINREYCGIDEQLNIGGENFGLDTMMNDYQNNNYDIIDENIGSIQAVIDILKIKSNSALQQMLPTYEKLPPTLSYILFSQQYFNNPGITKDSAFTSLLLYLINNKDFDYIVIDGGNDTKDKLLSQAISSSRLIEMVISQDMRCIEAGKWMLDGLEQIRLPQTQIEVIVNKLSKHINTSEITKMFKTNVKFVPYNDEIELANFNKIPYVTQNFKFFL